MRNQGVIVFLTVVVTALCLYYLSFTFVSNNIQQKAVEFATDDAGNLDFAKKQSYLDSIYREPVYNFLGAKFTYKEIKETELASELSWCWVSFQNDSNPVGVAEKGALALDAFKAAREVNSKAVAKKLVDDLEKALA